MDEGTCEISGCGSTSNQTVRDSYYKKNVCSNCFQTAFKIAQENGIGEWFEKNYDKKDYPAEFWKKVGAFVDLSATKSMDPYGVKQ